MVDHHSVTPELERAAGLKYPSSESSRWCSELETYGVGKDYTRGYRVCRTGYTPESDKGRSARCQKDPRTNHMLTETLNLATGLEILSAHMRQGLFNSASEGDFPDDLPSQQLWQRIRTEVVEDRDDFENVPPTAIQKHFQAWIEEQGYHLPNAKSPDPSLELAGLSTHRFCIIIDAEALKNLLRFPLPPRFYIEIGNHVGVKVLDVECNADSCEYQPPFDEGWIRAAPRELPKIWFECHMLALDEMRDENDDGQPGMSEYC